MAVSMEGDFETIETFLRSLGLENSVTSFQENGIDLRVLMNSTESELENMLKRIDLLIGSRYKIMQKIRNLKANDLSSNAIQLVTHGEEVCIQIGNHNMCRLNIDVSNELQTEEESGSTNDEGDLVQMTLQMHTASSSGIFIASLEERMLLALSGNQREEINRVLREKFGVEIIVCKRGSVVLVMRKIKPIFKGLVYQKNQLDFLSTLFELLGFSKKHPSEINLQVQLKSGDDTFNESQLKEKGLQLMLSPRKTIACMTKEDQKKLVSCLFLKTIGSNLGDNSTSELQIKEDTEKCLTSINELRERVDKLEETADCSPYKRKKTSKVLNHPALELSIDVSDRLLIHHITGIRSDRLWVGGFSYMKEKILKQVDSTGNVIETINDADSFFGNFAITQNGELLYLQKGCNKVQKMTPNGTTTIISTSEDENIKALFSSQITGNLLVGVHKCQANAGKLTRYEETGAKIKDIEVDNDGKTLYSNPTYIAENRNGDIVTADSTKHRVVLVDRSGEYRGYYNGQTPNKREFDPHGVCTDVKGQIMVVDYTSGSIHLLDQDLRFQKLLLTKEQHNLIGASALFIDENHHLYVGSENGRINVYRYLNDE